MNERIKQLIEKATVRGEEYLPGNDGHPTPTFYFDKEKFAELIVRDCAEAALAKGKASPYTDFRTGSYVISEYLLSRYGVEE